MVCVQVGDERPGGPVDVDRFKAPAGLAEEACQRRGVLERIDQNSRGVACEFDPGPREAPQRGSGSANTVVHRSMPSWSSASTPKWPLAETPSTGSPSPDLSEPEAPQSGVAGGVSASWATLSRPAGWPYEVGIGLVS